MDYNDKSNLYFISMIRLPDFVTNKDLEWAIREMTKKKKKDFSKVELFRYEEGLCVQCMHVRSYDEEDRTIEKMREYAQENGYKIATDNIRRHHEIYMSDPRKVSAERLKTILRLPIR